MANCSLSGFQKNPLATVIICATLSACGGGGSGGGNSSAGSAEPVGTLQDPIANPTEGNSDETVALLRGRALGQVTFFETPDVNPEQRFISAVAEFASADTVAAELDQGTTLDPEMGCTTGPVNVSSNPPLLNSNERISAGQAIIVTSPDGTVLELTPVNAGGVTVYQSGVAQESGTTLNALSLSIPGDDYPALTSVDVPVNLPLTNLEPDLIALITPETEFRWNAGPAAGTVLVQVVFESLGAENVQVDCRVNDTGRLALPTGIQNELQGMAARGWNIQREARTEIATDTAVLRVLRQTNP